MGYAAPWSYTWAPFGGPLWMGRPPPAALVPSVWPRSISSFDPPVGSQRLATMASSVFPYPMGPPPPYSSVPPALSRDSCGHYTQRSFSLEEMPSPSIRMGLHSTVSLWAPALSPGPELCPLPPSPSADPQPDPGCPRSPRPPCRACHHLFQC
ncbi:putative uncharacterized protein C3orf56 homolog [Leopardus geoffroyi]|uniref:putative uncharacterized protein C3orf56 homolog n=1 Tax=Leopardus geoffroyi TaxID=46844 RepID=UPI001E261217|nr:putative uncharacterized protein C3orf56 homolog [Leopardus geoffroyi]